jgi:predicted RNase H-like HicB family nuclease
MLTAYIEAAMRHASCEWLSEDGIHYCDIPELPGVWSSGEDEAAALVELQEVLEGWIVLGLALRHPIPAVDGIEISVGITVDGHHQPG